MEGWALKGSGRSFGDLFEAQIDRPNDNSNSQTLKSLTVEEIHSSGSSLKILESLDVSTLNLSPGHGYEWAVEKLDEYAPIVDGSSWDATRINRRMPLRIYEETNAVEYIRFGFLERALCAGVFLFSLSTGAASQPCPDREGFNILPRPSSGGSGRPDLQMCSGTSDNPYLLVEGKTRRVCEIAGGDLLEVIPQNLGGMLLYGDEGYNASILANAGGPQKKKISIVYQVC
jgi:hypothetical protein